jgi:hypothetical protein
MRPMESSVVRTSQEGVGYTFNYVGGAYRDRDGVARPFEIFGLLRFIWK